MNKKIYLQPFIYSALLCVGLVIGFLIPKNASNKFTEVLDIVNRDYVDSVGDDLEYQMVSKYLSSLDPHSVYIPAKYYKYAQESLRGNYEGIGIEFGMVDTQVYVMRVVMDGPAYKAGLKTGDQILMADGVSFQTTDISYKTVVESLKGFANEVLVLKIKKRDNSIKLYEITRESVANSSIRAAFVYKNKGYINFSRFSNNSHQEFLKSLKELKEIGFETLVVDLRGNGGGFLKEAQKIVNEFLEKDQLIAYIKGRNRKKDYFYADGEGIYKTGELVLLIDNNTASASEILSGALQDHDRAKIIGKSSYGKGLVQETYYFKDSSTMKLTVSRYYLPTGRSIQRNYQSLTDSLNSDTFYTLVKKRKMIDGNGVHPDIEYPMDLNDSLEDAIWYVLKNNQTDKFVLRDYKKVEYKSPKEFIDRFTVQMDKVKTLLGEIQRTDHINLPVSNPKFIQRIQEELRNKIAYNYYGTEFFHYCEVHSENWIDLL